MGYAKTWLAVKGASRADVLAALGLGGTGRFEELAESTYDGAALPSGWYLVAGECADARLLDEARLARLAAKGDVVTVSVEEHVMYSTAAGWSGGRELWSVTHASERGRDHLAVVGNPPEPFGEIRDRLLADQRSEDEANELTSQIGGGVDHVFDVPVDLGFALVTYRHDQDIEGVGGAPFEILEPAAAPKPAQPAKRRARPIRREEPSFWKRLFGG
jgi:hypothetical protein